MEGHVYKLFWRITLENAFGYQETDHLLWAYHFPLISFGWGRECECHVSAAR